MRWLLACLMLALTACVEAPTGPRLTPAEGPCVNVVWEGTPQCAWVIETYGKGGVG